MGRLSDPRGARRVGWVCCTPHVRGPGGPPCGILVARVAVCTLERLRLRASSKSVLFSNRSSLHVLKQSQSTGRHCRCSLCTTYANSPAHERAFTLKRIIASRQTPQRTVLFACPHLPPPGGARGHAANPGPPRAISKLCCCILRPRASASRRTVIVDAWRHPGRARR